MEKESLKEKQIGKLYGYRWLILGNYCLLSFGSGMVFSLLASEATSLSKAYNISLSFLSLNSLFYLAIYPFANLFLCTKIYNKWGLKIYIYSGIIFEFICIWLRVLVNVSFNFITISGIFAGLALPFIINAGPEVSQIWFSQTERVITNGIIVILNSIGGFIGSIYLLLFVDPYYSDVNVFKKQLFFALLIFAIVMTIVFALTFIFFRESPPSPPTLAAIIQEDTNDRKNINIFTDFKALLNNCNFVMESLIFGIYFGNISVISLCVQMILSQFGFTNNDCALSSLFFTISGIITSFLLAVILAKTNAYKFLTIILSIFTTIMFVYYSIASYLNKINLLCLFSAFLGMGIIPLLSITFQYGVEVAHPVKPTSVSGFQLSITEIYTIALVLIITSILPSEESVNPKRGVIALIILFCGMVSGIFFAFKVKEDLRRLLSELELKLKSESESESESKNFQN